MRIALPLVDREAASTLSGVHVEVSVWSLKYGHICHMVSLPPRLYAKGVIAVVT